MKNKVKEIRWVPRYSDTDEPDKQGRWARIAYCGDFDEPFDSKGQQRLFQIAWVNMVTLKSGEVRYSATYYFPQNNIGSVFKNFEEAKDVTESEFKKFINHIIEHEQNIK